MSLYQLLFVVPTTSAQKKVDRKEYPDLQSFANDVELIFYNAYTFNEENSFVANDAKVLQVRSNTVTIFFDSHLTHRNYSEP